MANFIVLALKFDFFIVKRPRIRGLSLLLYQFVALLVKRFHYTRRKPLAFLVQNVLPLGVIGMSLAIAHYILSVSDPPSLLLHPSLFFSFTGKNYMMAYEGNASKNYADTLYRPCGIGAKYFEDPSDPNSMCYYDTPPDSCNGYPEPRFDCSSQCDCYNRTTPPYNPHCFNGTVVRIFSLSLSLFSNMIVLSPTCILYVDWYQDSECVWL